MYQNHMCNSNLLIHSVKNGSLTIILWNKENEKKNVKDSWHVTAFKNFEILDCQEIKHESKPIWSLPL